jgi:hypothetical protein
VLRPESRKQTAAPDLALIIKEAKASGTVSLRQMAAGLNVKGIKRRAVATGAPSR